MKGKKLSREEKEAKLEADANERRVLFRKLCAHLEEGLSIESFYLVSDKTIYRMLENYPKEFDKEELLIAKKQGRDYWERIGQRQARGDCLGNSRTWFYNMANRYGWRDKIDVEAEHKGSVSINVVSYATKKATQGTDDGL